MMLITIGIVGFGVGLFLVFRYFRIMDMQSTDIVVAMGRTNNTMEEQIIDKITIGMAGFQIYINIYQRTFSHLKHWTLIRFAKMWVLIFV